MDYKELQTAVVDTYRRRHYAEGFELVDRFMDGATGEELAGALSLKASLILLIDQRRAPEGISLLDEALACCENDHSLRLRCLTTALGLCYLMGDVTRAERYEVTWNQLLQEYGDRAEVQTGQFRLHWNMGLIARLRGEHATAYWHFVQSIHCLRTYGSEEPSDQQSFLLCLHLVLADTCVDMHRWPEAEEALEAAGRLVASPQDSIEHGISHVKWLRAVGRHADAERRLRALQLTSNVDWNPELRVRYHLLAAQVAGDAGDLRTHHYHLNVARMEAETNASTLEYLLSDIQRAQRVPMNLGVVER